MVHVAVRRTDNNSSVDVGLDRRLRVRDKARAGTSKDRTIAQRVRAIFQEEDKNDCRPTVQELLRNNKAGRPNNAFRS